MTQQLENLMPNQDSKRSVRGRPRGAARAPGRAESTDARRERVVRLAAPLFLKRGYDNVSIVVMAIHVDTAGSLEAQLTEIGHSFLAMVLSPPILEFHRLMVSIGRTFPETGRLFFETGPASAYSTVAVWIAKQQEDGRIGPEDPYRLAVLFLDMLIGEHQLSWLTGARRAARRDKIDETVRLAVKVFLRGCAPG
jgi:TetR/AcrR family transcriptional repressor of mexJK operon